MQDSARKPTESPFAAVDLNSARGQYALQTPPLFKEGTTKLQQQVQKKLLLSKENNTAIKGEGKSPPLSAQPKRDKALICKPIS